jgi:microcystin-dependent protein
MSQPFIGECRPVGFSFAPAGWAMCQGQLMPISENDTLFNLIGTTFGGDGQETFAMPDLQGRVPIHQGSNAGQTFQVGEKAGVESVTLIAQQIPIHNHQIIVAGGNGNANIMQNQYLAGASTKVFTANPVLDSNMNANSLTQVGGSQPHENLQPYLTISWIISLFGIFPSQN